jgi:hypothetical protein
VYENKYKNNSGKEFKKRSKRVKDRTRKGGEAFIKICFMVAVKYVLFSDP